VFLDIGPLGGNPVLGGRWLNHALKERAQEGWMADGEDRKAADRLSPAEGVRARPEELQAAGETYNILYRLGRVGRINVLFDRRSGVHRSGMVSSLAGRLPEVIGALTEGPLALGLVWKRWEEFYLFRPENWDLVEMEGAPPWAVVRDLRKSAGGNDGYLRPEDWLNLSRLQLAQIERLSLDYPDASQVRNYHILFRLAADMTEQERALSARPEGSGWSDWTEATQRRVRVLYPAEDALNARLVLQWDREARPPKARIFLGVPQPGKQPREVLFKRKQDEKPPPRRVEIR
jgi:hypothetical protein